MVHIHQRKKTPGGCIDRLARYGSCRESVHGVVGTMNAARSRPDWLATVQSGRKQAQSRVCTPGKRPSCTVQGMCFCHQQNSRTPLMLILFGMYIKQAANQPKRSLNNTKPGVLWVEFGTGVHFRWQFME